MKKQSWTAAFFLLFVILFAIPGYVQAEETDDGFYIQNMDVHVLVTEAREYQVTETIDVYFLEERHGIYRNISTQSAAERYEITDISVEGAAADISEYGTSVDIKIGDPDETVTGKQQYVIRYTLDHYDDGVPDADYLYLDVLGTEWTTYIEHFSAEVVYPEQAILENYTVTGGSYGSSGMPDYLSCSQEENRFLFESTKSIPSYSGITLKAEFQQGAFLQAPVFEYPYTVKQMNTEIEITSEKEYLIRSDYVVDMKEGMESAYFSIFPSGDDYKISDVVLHHVSDENIYVTYRESDVCISSGLTGEQSFSISMRVRPRMKEPMVFDVTPHYFGGGIDAVVEQLDLKIISPFPVEGYQTDGYSGDKIVVYTPSAAENVDSYDGLCRDILDYQFNEDQTVLTVSSVQPFDASERELAIRFILDEGSFFRPPSTGMIITIVLAGIVLLIQILLYFLFGRDRPLHPPVELYPPDGYNSAEAGYAIDQSLSASDVTSLIFYWASHRHLTIHDIDGSFVLVKGIPLDESHKKYERKLYDAMFRRGDGNTVSQEELREHFYVDIGVAQKSVKKTFTGNFALTDKNSSVARALGVVFCCIPLLIYGFTGADGYLMDAFTGIFMSIFVMIGLLGCFGILVWTAKGYHRRTKGRKAVSWITAILFSALYFGLSCWVYCFAGYPVWLTLLIVGIVYGAMIISVFVTRRSQYGAYILERLLGYKKFMETAEKERLEAMLQEDPEYFYHTLPFAQVLGVTDIWCDKFRLIEMPPPAWYDCGDGGYFDYSAMVLFTRQISRFSSEISSSPASSGGDGGLSGGGFSGGGFSGGGSGGGGGGSW